MIMATIALLVLWLIGISINKGIADFG
jgi:hypothetical protein